MRAKHVLIIGGGVAGMSAGCYALRNGFRATIVEHNLALGGVCTAWSRPPYLVDGCIHWLTGGPFERLYRELEIVPEVPLRVLDTWVTYRDARDGAEVAIRRDLDATFARLRELAPEDAAELQRMRDAIAHVRAVETPIDAPELVGALERVRQLWEMRGAVGSMIHFRKSLGDWARERLRSERLRGLLTAMMPASSPALFLLFVLGYLERGWLSRPTGGTAAFRDALEQTFRRRGGEVVLHATVDEVLVTDGRARGVRLADGTMLDADVVVSTASTPETVLRLLGGRFDAEPTLERMKHWKMFDPIVLASFGVALPLTDQPSLLVVDGIPPFEIGGHANRQIYLRIGNDEPAFAPPGHSVVQAMVATDYAWWATRGTGYGAAKDEVARVLLDRLAPLLPGMRDAVRMTDLATPLTYWSTARSWRGAYEGWMPSADAVLGHVEKRLHGLDGFYLCGQWVEPGGGIPTAVMSGRQAIELVCAAEERQFTA